MGGLFDDIAQTFTKWMVKGAWEGTKLAGKAIASANAKAQDKQITTSEFTELLDEAQKGNSDAQCELYLYYAEKKDYETAIYWIKKAAEQGNETALEVLDYLQSE